jgi:hypothetical protein
MPCRKGFRMCLSHLIYTVRSCLIHTCHAMLQPCRSSQGHAWHSTSVERWPVGYLPAFGFFWLPRRVLLWEPYQSSSQWSIPLTVKSGSCTLQKREKKNCWTSSSDISGYHADFHEGHSTVGAWQGRSMAWQGLGMLCVNRPLLDTVVFLLPLCLTNSFSIVLHTFPTLHYRMLVTIVCTTVW